MSMSVQSSIKPTASVRLYGFSIVILTGLYGILYLVPFYIYNIKAYYRPEIENSMPNAHQFFPYNQALLPYFRWVDVAALVAVMAILCIPIFSGFMFWKMYIKRIPISHIERIVWTIVTALVLLFLIFTYRDSMIVAQWLIN